MNKIVKIVISLVVVSFAIWWFCTPKLYYFEIPVNFELSKVPSTDVYIDGNHYLVKIDLGSKLELSLNKSILDRIKNKRFNGNAEWKDCFCNEYTSSSYVIAKIGIENLTFSNVIAVEEREDCKNNTTLWNVHHIPDREVGALGRSLLAKRNLLLDFRNFRIVASNDIKKLKQNGFNIEACIKVPFEMTKIGLTLRVNTDMGVKNFCLDTGSTLTFVKLVVSKGKPCLQDRYGVCFFSTSKFEIGGINFGSVKLYPLAISDKLEEIDGLLGMDFLKKHVTYIDFHNKVIYIDKHDFYHVAIPVKLGPSNEPIVDVKIGENSYTFGCDIADTTPLSLRKDKLDKISQKTFDRVQKWCNLTGVNSESNIYLIPEVKIGDRVTFSKVPIRENPIPNEKNKPDGWVGKDLLINSNLLIDLKHSRMFISNDKILLKKEGIDIEKMKKIEISEYKSVPILPVNTDFGIKRFILSTRAPITIIGKNNGDRSVITTSKFIIGDCDFGKQDLHLFDIPSDFGNADGFIGLDFIKNHIIYIDAQDKTVYIELCR